MVIIALGNSLQIFKFERIQMKLIEKRQWLAVLNGWKYSEKKLND